jgi:hypothetical protein
MKYGHHGSQVYEFWVRGRLGETVLSIFPDLQARARGPGRSQEARRHLERSVALARQARQPNHEYGSLVHLAVAEMDQSFAQAAHRSRQAIDLAARHGWSDWSGDGVSFAVLADILAWQARPEEAQPWVLRAERARTAYAEPAGSPRQVWRPLYLRTAC